MRIYLLIVMCIATPLFSGNIDIFNSSDYTLRAVICSKIDEELTSISIKPKASVTWQDGIFNSPGDSQGPYNIYLYCENDTFYGKILKVPRNGSVNVKRAAGRKKCISK